MPTCPKCNHTWTEVPSSDIRPFPYKVTWENDSDQGNGAACILFRTLKDSDVTAVAVNNEVSRKGNSYKGCPVFLMSKPGDQYTRPLVMVIVMSDGQKYSFVAGSSGETPGGPTPTGDYAHKATYTSYGVRNQGRRAWRISKSGKDLGSGPIKFVFASGKTFIVKNPLKNCRDQENCSRNSKAPMYGFVYKPGIGPNGEGDNDTGTSHNGIYLHAPFGDSSKTVTMYW